LPEAKAFAEVMKERDEARAEAQCQKRKAEQLNWEFERLSKAASKKIESLEKDLAQAISALHDARLENSGQAMLLERKRPEPSRLEIAAMTLAARSTSTFFQEPNSEARHALAAADALIAAAKEGK
jgi:long-subunit acyl-CoA synthetase (AMP-forming)